MNYHSVCLMAAGLMFAHFEATSQADVFSIGPRAGINISDVSNIDDSQTSIGLVLGATSTYSISETVGLTLDVLYSQEGYEFEDLLTVNLDYLQIPLYFNAFIGRLGDAFRPKVYVGISPGILLNAKSNDLDISDMSNRLVVSATGGAGLNYRIMDRVWLNADVRSFIGLTDIREKDFREGDETNAARNVQLSLGLAFGLSRLEN